ncbi:Surfeit locus protein [Gracilaria domingensis]|nr:Surfeit locus protein [Gracilaria domingensis]
MLARIAALSIHSKHAAPVTSLILRRTFSADAHASGQRAPQATRGRSSASGNGFRSSSLLFGVPIALTFSLGVWQVYRLRRKERLIVERKQRLSSPPIDTTVLFQDSDTDHRRVQVTGRFLHEYEMLVGPRSAPKDTPMPVLQWGGSTGLQVLTPLKTEEGRIVLVNRGWIPQRLSSRSRRDDAQVNPYSFMTKFDRNTEVYDYNDSSAHPSQVSFVGIVRSTDDRNRFTPENVPAKNEWFYVDANAMLNAHGLEGCDRVVELVEPYPHAGWPYPRGIELYAEFRTPPSTHITYAITWFSLSACIALLTRFRVRQKRSL